MTGQTHSGGKATIRVKTEKTTQKQQLLFLNIYHYKLYITHVRSQGHQASARKAGDPMPHCRSSIAQRFQHRLSQANLAMLT